MKNRIEYAIKRLTKKLAESISMLDSVPKQYVYTDEDFLLLKSIIGKSYSLGLVSESEFVSLFKILGKNNDDFNSHGFIEKSVLWFFITIVADKV